jgi:hypothetical protein
VQVDERDQRDPGTISNTSLTGFRLLCYTDPNTFTGPDTNATVDADDEIVFMAKDTGQKPIIFSEPQGVLLDTGVEVTVGDPLSGGQDAGYIYLFQSNGALSSSAGKKYVDYTFSLKAGDYKTKYDTVRGRNPEDSWAGSAYYKHHFSERWVNDALHNYLGSGVNQWDRDKVQFQPGDCIRTEETFCNGGGSFVVNKSGPVRAIRSYFGANSGPYTQREHLFYERRQDVTTYLRVHEISGVMTYIDYNTNGGKGLKYYNNLNTAGVVIDGKADRVNLGGLAWELVTGPPGSEVIVHRLDTNIPGLPVTSYYLDNTRPRDRQCTGDAYAYGSSGPRISGTIASTDPRVSPYTLSSTRIFYYEPPNMTVAAAEQRYSFATNPLTITTAPWRAPILTTP